MREATKNLACNKTFRLLLGLVLMKHDYEMHWFWSCSARRDLVLMLDTVHRILFALFPHATEAICTFLFRAKKNKLFWMINAQELSTVLPFNTPPPLGPVVLKCNCEKGLGICQS